MTLLVSGFVMSEFCNNYDRPKLYDWSLTLPQEVEYIWRASWNWSKVLYLLTRYIPFATITVNLRSELLSLVDATTHRFWMKLTSHVSLDMTFHVMVPPARSGRPLAV